MLIQNSSRSSAYILDYNKNIPKLDNEYRLIITHFPNEKSRVFSTLLFFFTVSVLLFNHAAIPTVAVDKALLAG
ncbi:MAG TPA: hypothetical protein H9876_04915, partial [Candidatus Limosilactobacillus merdipullorum]|nr:hypothetical protein [Candidatus Limosilactobacillus merdipullorum]